MTRKVDPVELFAGVDAFNQLVWAGCTCGDQSWPAARDDDCYKHGNQQAEQAVVAVVEAVLPILEAKARQQVEDQAAILVGAIVAAAGGRISITEAELLAAPRELIRWDDPSTRSVVFATKEAALAHPERTGPLDRTG